MPYTEEQLEGLTDEEREGLSLDDEADAASNGGEDGDPDDAPDADPAPDAGEGNADADADPAAGDADADPAPDADADPAPAAEPDPAPAPEQPKEPAPSAPILVIEAPADAAERLAAIAAKKEEIAQQFDDGEITAKEFQKLTDAENKAERDIERQVHAAEIAKAMEDQRIQREWISQCDAFVAEHPEYSDPTSKPYQLLNEAILTIAKMPSNQGLSNAAALAKAHRIVQAELGTSTPAAPAPGKAKQPQAKVPHQPAPPNIGKLPAAAIPDTSRGEFAALDRLQSRDPDAYEDALMKMSAAQRDKYLRS